MGSRYLFIVLYVFLEHHLSRGDYRRPGFDEESHRGELRRRPLAARLRSGSSGTIPTPGHQRRGPD
jgi:hypothetical protein